MSVVKMKPFRIERMAQSSQVNPKETQNIDDIDAYRHDQIMAALSELRDGTDGNTAEQGQISEEMLAKLREDHAEADRVRAELAEMYRAIADTKQEIATLHHNSFSREAQSAVSDELDAVVGHTEQATETILTAAETIETSANDLVASLKLEGNNQMAADIQDQILHIFEACNFQDLTGQRITKVVNTLKFIEERISGIMEIWGGEDGFKNVVPEHTKKPQGDAALLHGPAMNDDPTSASQDDIDALFD